MRKLSRFLFLTFPTLLILALALGGVLTEAYSLDTIVPLSGTFVYNLFISIFDTLGDVTSNVEQFNYLAWLFTYMTFYTMLDIVFHVIAFLPRLGKKWIDQLSGGDF